MLIDDVRLALGYTTTAFDGEISDAIDACLLSMKNLGVANAQDEPIDPQVKQAVIFYCKARVRFNDDADRWEKLYNEKLAELKMQTGYTNWGTVEA